MAGSGSSMEEADVRHPANGEMRRTVESAREGGHRRVRRVYPGQGNLAEQESGREAHRGAGNAARSLLGGGSASKGHGGGDSGVPECGEVVRGREEGEGAA